MLKFEQINVGDKSELKHLLTQEDVQSFAALTNDFNPLHVDEAFAKKTLFRKPVVHGMLSASFISTIIGMSLPGKGSLWTRQTLEFLLPAHVGDTLTVEAKVKQKSQATRTLLLDIVITNQLGQQLITGEAAVKLLELLNEEVPVTIESSKTVLITGGSGGIGAATARRLAADGYTVIVGFLNAPEKAQTIVGDILQNNGRAIAVCGNIAQISDVERMFTEARDAFGAIQAVVHCAAVGSRLRPFDELSWEMVQNQLDIQLRGAFNCARAALPSMLEAGSGSLVFLGSMAADGVPPVNQTDYVLAKAALASFARTLAVEYGPKGIRVNVVAPGMTKTDMIADLPDKAKMLARMQTPLRRLADPEDIANAIAFLLSSGAKHITGETLRVCGGAVMN